MPHVIHDGDNVRIGRDEPAEKVKPKGILEKTKELLYRKNVPD